METGAPALHRSIVCVDVEGYGDQARTDQDQIDVRAALYAALQAAFSDSGVRWESCYREDRGDGALFLIPPGVPKECLAGPFPARLAALLERHNRTAGPGARIRLRVAVHAGEVRSDAHGVVGSAINRAFRLLEAAPLKRALRESPGSLALIVSDWFYDEVVRHSPSCEPGSYRSAQVSVKETRTCGWIRLVGGQGAVPAAAAPVRVAAHVPRQLPPAVRHFVGRVPELGVLDRLLSEPDDAMAIAVITGAPGVGKTALAVHAAHRFRDLFPDGQLYVDLHGYAAVPQVRPQQALRGLLHGLGVPTQTFPADVCAQSAMYRSLLDGRRVLVVLDNAGDAAQIRHLLPGAPGCAVIVTSRSTLSGCVARDGAHLLHLDRLADDEAVTLLRRIIGPAKVDAAPARAADLARRCAFLPLALRIAAERAARRPRLGLDDLVEELDEAGSLDVLDGDDEHTAMRTVFSWSYRALPPDTARAFRLLALHPGPEISRTAAAALLDAAPARTRQLLDALVCAHLLEEPVPGRHSFSGLLRSYAAELDELDRDEQTARDRAAATRRVLAWYLGTADIAREILCPRRVTASLAPPGDPWPPRAFASPAEAQRWCEAERCNLIAAARLAARAGQHDIAWRLPLALWTFFFLRNAWTDWIDVLRTGLHSARRIGDRGGEAYTLGVLGYESQNRWCFEESIGFLQTARDLFVQTGDRKGESWALHGLGYACRRGRRFDEAIEYHRRSLKLAREVRDRRSAGWALTALGYAYGSLHRFAESLDHFREARDIARDTERRAEGWALHGLGYAHQGLGRLERAIAYYRDALEIFREIGDRFGQGEALYNLGRAQARLGRPEAARRTWNEALDIFQDLQTPQVEGVRARLLSLDDTGAPVLPAAETAVPSP